MLSVQDAILILPQVPLKPKSKLKIIGFVIVFFFLLFRALKVLWYHVVAFTFNELCADMYSTRFFF